MFQHLVVTNFTSHRYGSQNLSTYLNCYVCIIRDSSRDGRSKVIGLYKLKTLLLFYPYSTGSQKATVNYYIYKEEGRMFKTKNAFANIRKKTMSKILFLYNNNQRVR